MAFETVVEFTEIHIIESLPAPDAQTGLELCDAVLHPAQYEHGLVYPHHHGPTRERLVEALNSILQRAGGGAIPIIHFETHGSANGIRLSSHELLSWEELA